MARDTTSANLAATLAGFLLAPLGASLVIMVSALVRRSMDGIEFPRSLTELDYAVRFPLLMTVPLMALVFWLVGGPLAIGFRKRAPFGFVACSLVGAVCGAFALYVLAAGLSDPDDMLAYGGRESQYYVDWALFVLLGAAAGWAGGVTFWRISRVGWRRPA